VFLRILALSFCQDQVLLSDRSYPPLSVSGGFAEGVALVLSTED
jgi:hypothetical protein